MHRNDKSDFRFLMTILNRRGDDTKDDPSFRAVRSHLRRGADSSTEHYAIPHVFPHLPESASNSQQRTLLRVAAIAAEYSRVPSVKYHSGYIRKSFGRWCNELSRALASRANPTTPDSDSPANFQSNSEPIRLDQSKPDVIAQRLAYLHTENFEEAVLSVRRILQIAQGLNPTPSLDYIDLYKMLSHWSNGISEASQQVRLGPLRDYYSASGRSDEFPTGPPTIKNSNN